MQYLRKLIPEVAAFIKEKDCFRLLTDFRNATATPSIMMLYEIPRLIVTQTRDVGISIYQVKRALVAPARLMDKMKFFETVSANRSQMIRIFRDIDEARAWLLS